MKKLYLLLGCMTLAACNAGGGSTGPQGAPGKSAYEIWLEQGNTGSEQDFLDSLSNGHKQPSSDDIDELLKDSEKLFGKGKGLDGTPTELMERLDNAGQKYFSFGSWGNVYDIYSLSSARVNLSEFERFPSSEHYYFVTNSENENWKDWKYSSDASVKNSTFTGPVLMHYQAKYSPYTYEYNPDYGSMELKFGQTGYSVNIVMHNPENNLSFTSENKQEVLRDEGNFPSSASASFYFSEDRQKLHGYITKDVEHEHLGNGNFMIVTKHYEVYGKKQ